MKFLAFILIAASLWSCSPGKTNPEEFSEDYVLIEFAAKLEEEYHRINKTPYDSHHANPSPDEKLPEDNMINNHPNGKDSLPEEEHSPE